jgi:hypothetical protein
MALAEIASYQLGPIWYVASSSPSALLSPLNGFADVRSMAWCSMEIIGVLRSAVNVAKRYDTR